MHQVLLTIGRQLHAIASSPKTSVPGLSMMLGAIGMIIHHPGALLDQGTVAPILIAFFGGYGLLMASDEKEKK